MIAGGQFDIRHSGESIDPGVLVRTHIRRYRIDGDRVQRVQPVALDARDFADEWIVSPWSEAADWSAHSSRLRRVHARLAHMAEHFELTFKSVRGCGGGRTQVWVENDEGRGAILLVRGRGPFKLEQILASPSADCRGRDQMRFH